MKNSVQEVVAGWGVIIASVIMAGFLYQEEFKVMSYGQKGGFVICWLAFMGLVFSISIAPKKSDK